MHRLLHDIPRFSVLFLEELFLIFNQIMSIGSFGRHELGIVHVFLQFYITQIPSELIIFLSQNSVDPDQLASSEAS